MRTLLPRLLLVAVAALALLPLGRLAADWWAVVQVVGADLPARPPRGFDWVKWVERDGEVAAGYVYPGGTADRAGLRPGARLYRLDGRQFFSADDVRAVVEGFAPGREVAYEIVDDGAAETVTIRITRYPTFLYPLGAALWQAALWGFALAAFVHGLALLVVAPLGGRTGRARRRLVLIAAASVWAFGTLGRLVALTLLGPPVGGAYAAAFDALTYVSLAGWLAFPALLLRTVLLDRPAPAPAPWRAVLFLPPLALAAAVAAALRRVGPLTLDALVGPILFYVGVYVATAAAVVLTAGGARATDADEAAWSRVGTAVVGALAALGALLVWGVGLRPDPTGATGAWVVLALQLLPLAPVVLVSTATLRHGRTDGVIAQALAYLAAVGVVFFAFVGGLSALERLGAAERVSWPVLAALFAAGAVVVGERLARAVAARAAGWWPTERQRARQRLRAFGERARLAVDAQRLADDAAEAVGEALQPRSAALWLRAPGGGWLWAGYRSEDPRFTEADLLAVWDALGARGRVWAQNAELDEGGLPPEAHALLRRRGAALAVPVAGEDGAPAGLLVLAPKARRRAVYNVEDVAMLRNLAAQLALARDRLALLERERELVRETAEAELTALRAQINPHFLFNALNTIAALVAERPDEAEGVVERLAAIFRHTLQTGGDAFVRLRDETQLVENYLAIEAARFGAKLAVRRDWDPGLADLAVPAFVVQTLVENAVKHGIERQRGGGTVTLASRRVEWEGAPWAEIEVADTGVGIPALYGGGDGTGAEGAGGPGEAAAAFYGIGLVNVSSRLARLYGRPDLLTIRSSPEGTTARVRLPLEGT